jgi:hypothetical protein
MDIHILFIFLVLIGLPIGSVLAIFSERIRQLIFFVMVFATAFSQECTIYYFRDAFVQRSSPGLEIHLSDLCAIMLFISMVFRRQKFVKLIPMTIPYGIYLLGGIIAWLVTEEGRYYSGYISETVYMDLRAYPIFEMIKILRAYFIMWVSVQMLASFSYFKVFYKAVLSAVVCITLLALWERYITHMHRCWSSIPGPNDFACYAGMAGIFFLPFVFVRKSLWQSLGVLLIYVLGGTSVILSISRSSLAAYCAMSLIIMTVFMIRFFSIKNLVILLVALVSCGFLGLKSYSTLCERFITSETIEGGIQARDPFIKEVDLMLQDHPLGVGMGNFGAYSAMKYARETGADVGLRPHNIWYLTFAETGFLGLIGFGLLWLRCFHMIFTLLFSTSMKFSPTMFAAVFGVFGAASVCMFQNIYHFCYQNVAIFFLMHMFFGLLARIYIDSAVYGRTKELTPLLKTQI